MPFATLFAGVAAKLFGGAPAGGGVEHELVELAVEAVVDAVDPRLRTLSGYRAKLAPAVTATIVHLRSLAQDLPAPVLLARGAWGSDALLNACFATAEDISATLGRCEELRELFASPAAAGSEEAFALLGMLKEERNVLAPAIVDGQLRQDVAQTTVGFRRQTLFAPGTNLIACRRGVGLQIFRRLAALVLQRITALEERATELEQRKALLGARLRMLHLRANGLHGAATEAADDAAEIARIEGELKATVDNYVDARAGLATLESRLAHVNAVFGAPAEHIGLARVELRLNRLGYKVPAESAEPAAELALSELAIGEGLKVIVQFVRCPRSELPPRRSLAENAALAGF